MCRSAVSKLTRGNVQPNITHGLIRIGAPQEFGLHSREVFTDRAVGAVAVVPRPARGPTSTSVRCSRRLCCSHAHPDPLEWPGHASFHRESSPILGRTGPECTTAARACCCGKSESDGLTAAHQVLPLGRRRRSWKFGRHARRRRSRSRLPGRRVSCMRRW